MEKTYQNCNHWFVENSKNKCKMRPKAQANNVGTMGLKPDLTIMLDIAAEKGFARKKGSKQDRFEQEELSFHQKVREGYLKLAAAEPERWLVVDASQSRAKVERIIWQRVNQLLPGNRG